MTHNISDPEYHCMLVNLILDIDIISGYFWMFSEQVNKFCTFN